MGGGSKAVPPHDGAACDLQFTLLRMVNPSHEDSVLQALTHASMPGSTGTYIT